MFIGDKSLLKCSFKWRGGYYMSALQEQIIEKINGLSEDNLQFLLEMINRFM